MVRFHPGAQPDPRLSDSTEQGLAKRFQGLDEGSGTDGIFCRLGNGYKTKLISLTILLLTKEKITGLCRQPPLFAPFCTLSLQNQTQKKTNPKRKEEIREIHRSFHSAMRCIHETRNSITGYEKENSNYITNNRFVSAVGLVWRCFESCYKIGLTKRMTTRKLWFLGITSLQLIPYSIQKLHIALLWVLLQGHDESPRHGTSCLRSDGGIGSVRSAR